MSAPTLTDYAVAKLLDKAFGATDFTPPATFYLALLSGGVELTGNGYARIAITNNGTNWAATASRQKLMQVLQAFAAATGAWNTVEAWQLLDASVAGNSWLSGDTQDLPLYCRGAAADSTLKRTAHGRSNGDAVRVEAPAGHSLPTGLAAATTYYVVAAAADTFQLAATQGGAAITLTGDGMALVSLWFGKAGIVSTDVYQVPANGLKVCIPTAGLA